MGKCKSFALKECKDKQLLLRSIASEKKPRSQTKFLTLKAAKKVKFVKFGVKKAKLTTLKAALSDPS